MKFEHSFTLVVNLSLRSIRVIVFSATGQKVYHDWLPIRTKFDGSFVEQDPGEWWDQLMQLLATLRKNTSFFAHITHVSVTSSALCLVPVDATGQPLCHALMVSDKRASEEARELKNSSLGTFLLARSNVVIEPSYMMPKIMWLKKHEPLLFSRCHKFLSSNDFLVYKLTGVYLTDYLNAEKFYFNTKAWRYEPDVLTYVGMTEEMLPSVVGVGTAIGSIQPSVLQQTGLSSSCTVVIATYDALSAFVGSGVTKEGELANVCGTCSSYRTTFHTPLALNTHGMLSQYYKEENAYIIGGSNNLEGGVLEWAKECFYGDSFQKDDTFLYSLMQDEAKECALGAEGLLFLPYLLGERVPFWDPFVRGIFFGVERFHARRHFIRSVFESIGFQAKFMINSLEENGVAIHTIKMSGGLSQLDYMCQLRSDIIGKPIEQLDETETTALGVFIITKRAQGEHLTADSIREYSKIKRIFTPDVHNTKKYDELFILYKELYSASHALFASRKSIFDRMNSQKSTVLESL